MSAPKIVAPKMVALDDQVQGRTRLYTEPLTIIRAHSPLDVPEALASLEAYRADGYHLAGWLAYELGAAVEPALAHTLSDTGLLLEVGVFDSYADTLPDSLTRADAELDITLTPDWSEADYTTRFDQLKDYIAAGHVYQANLTFALRGQTDQSARSLYRNLRRRQLAAFGGLCTLGDTEIISLSPELFLRIEANQATLRPMKGTLARHPDPDTDRAARYAMTEDMKSRAENLMIVDLLRNDLSRIARPGTVRVPDLFTAETYATLHQMTSTITGQVDNPTLSQIISALFPCGSVTGAPKIRAMEIIDELEDRPRGPYCGSLFWAEPTAKGAAGHCCFNVAIRTLIKTDDQLIYNVGSGVVADSDAASEYAECLLKGDILRRPKPGLIETFRLGPKGFIRLERHLNRMERSARALDIPFNFHKITSTLAEIESDEADQRVRVELFPNNRAEITVTPLITKREPLRVVAGSRPLTSAVQPTAHKVTSRAYYDAELTRALAEGADEAILLNENGEVCEGTFTSVFIERDGTLLTPSLSSGLLPGILREHLIDEGRAVEATLTWQDVLEADTLYVGNSLRGLMIAEIV